MDQKPGNVLLYKASGNFLDQCLGKGISWAEWIDGKADTDLVHAAMYYGLRVPMLNGQWIVRQNPGGPAYEDSAAQPWAQIITKRLFVDGVFPGDDPNWVRCFDAQVNKHFEDGYGYGQIGDYLAEDLLARLGEGKVSDDLRTHAALLLDKHFNVCSEFDRVVIEGATDDWRRARGVFKQAFDLLPGVGKGQGRPPDLALTPLLV